MNVFKPSHIPAGKKLPVVIVGSLSDMSRLFSVLMLSFYAIVDLWGYVSLVFIVGVWLYDNSSGGFSVGSSSAYVSSYIGSAIRLPITTI